MSQQGDDQTHKKSEPLPYRPHSTTPANQMPMMNPYMNPAAFMNPYMNNDYWNYMNYQYMQFMNMQQFMSSQTMQQQAQIPASTTTTTTATTTASSQQQSTSNTNGISNVPPPVQFFDPYASYGGYGLGMPFNYPTQTQRPFDTQSLHSLRYETNSYAAPQSITRPQQAPSAPNNMEQQIQQFNASQLKGTQSVNSFKGEELESVKNDLDGNDSDLIKKERLTPLHHKLPHIKATFGLNCLVQVRANDPCQVQPALVDIYNLNDLIEDYLNEDSNYKLVQEFPGPLCRETTPKTLVIQFCQKRMKECLNNTNLIDPQSYALLWEFLALLVRQNGNIDLKTDISPLLINEDENWTFNSSTNGTITKSSSNQVVSSTFLNSEQDDESTNLVDNFSASSINKTSNKTLNDDEILSKLRQLLASGQKTDAIEWAIKYNLWSHAFFIGLSLDTKVLNKIKLRFINSIAQNDPIQTTYQLLIGRVPSVASNLAKFEWNDWKRHLATIVSNIDDSNRDLVVNSIKAIGDSLATNGRIAASHFCYLLAKCQFGDYKKKSSKLVLIGSSQNQDFNKFCQTTAIQATEVYEFAVQSTLDHLIKYKLIYALRLFDYGLFSEAYKYVRLIATHINQNLSANIDKLSTLFHLANRLRSQDIDSQLNDSLSEPLWLTELTSNFKKYYFNEHMNSSQKEDIIVNQQSQDHKTEAQINPIETTNGHQNINYNNDYQVTTNTYNQEENTNQQVNYDYSNQYYEQQQQQPAEIDYNQQNTNQNEPQNDYLNQPPPEQQSAPVFFNPYQFNYNSNANGYQQPAIDTQNQMLNPASNYNENSNEQIPQYNQEPQQQQHQNEQDDDLSFHNPKKNLNIVKNDSSDEVKKEPEEDKNKQKQSQQQSKSGITSLFSNLFSKQNGPKAMVLPDDKKKSIVWDDKLKQFVNKEKSDEPAEVKKPPPKISPLMTASTNLPPTGNQLQANNPYLRKKESYYSALQAKDSKKTTATTMNGQKSESLPSVLSTVPPPMQMPSTFFTPIPAQDSSSNTFYNPQQQAPN